MYQPSVRSATVGTAKTFLALVAILSLLLTSFAITRQVSAQEGGGQADCPSDTTFVINFPQGDIEVGDELIEGVFVTAVTRDESGELTSVTIENTTDENVTIAVKGGSDQVGNAVTIAPDSDATITVTNNPTISNLSVCLGPELEETPTLTVAKATVGGDDDFQFTLGGTNVALLSNGESQLVASEAGTFNLAEVLTQEQLDAGWSLTSIDCVNNATEEVVTGASVSVTVGADEDVVCTFTNTLAEDDEDVDVKIVKLFCDGGDTGVVFSVNGQNLPDGAEGCEEGSADFTLNDGEPFTVNGSLVTQVAAGLHTLAEVDAEGNVLGSVEFDAQEDEANEIDVTIIVYNFPGEVLPDNGLVEIDKIFCPTEGESRTDFIVIEPGSASAQNHMEEGCEIGAGVNFTISGGDLEEDLHETTNAQGEIELELAPGEYTITEDVSGDSETFTVLEGELTVIVVINLVAEEEDEAIVKIVKLSCESGDTGVVFSVNGENLPEGAEGCEEGDAAFTLNDGDPFVVDGALTMSVPTGTHTLAEIAPNEGSVEFDAELTEDVIDVTIIVYNFGGEGELPDETVTVSIMKHLCTDVTNVEQFEAVENAGVGGVPGGFGTVSGLAATVLACPTIVLTGDVPTSGAVSGGQVDFDFAVIDASGTQVLSSDGDFEAAALCESDIDIDVNLDGDKGDCLDVSHYMFEVVDGVVVITETEAPANSSGVGTLRFTPGTEDETALATSIETVESTGVITLNTTQASETALEDGMIMLHVYNFAEGEEQGGGAALPGQGGPRQGTLAGSLPNTATEPLSLPSMPATLLALVMLSGLGAAAYAVKAEVDRRR